MYSGNNNHLILDQTLLVILRVKGSIFWLTVYNGVFSWASCIRHKITTKSSSSAISSVVWQTVQKVCRRGRVPSRRTVSRLAAVTYRHTWVLDTSEPSWVPQGQVVRDLRLSCSHPGPNFLPISTPETFFCNGGNHYHSCNCHRRYRIFHRTTSLQQYSLHNDEIQIKKSRCFWSWPCPVWGRGTPPFPLVHLLRHLLFFFTFPFLSLALPIFFFCPSLPFLPE